MAYLFSTVVLFAILHSTHAAPHGGRQTSTVSTNYGISHSDLIDLVAASKSGYTVTDTGVFSTAAVAENTMIVDGFRSHRKGKNSLYPPVASPSTTPLPGSFIVIPGTTEEERHYSFPASHSTMTLVVRDDLNRLLMPLSKIADSSSKTTSLAARPTSSITPDDLTPLLMPLPNIVQPCNKTASPTASSTSTSTYEDLIPLLMPLPHIMDPSNSTTTLTARSMPHIMEPFNSTTTLAVRSTGTSAFEDLTPLLMPLPSIINPSDKTATPTASACQINIAEDLTSLLMPLPNVVEPRSFRDWAAEKVEEITGMDAEELRSAVDSWGNDGLAAAA